MRLLKYFSLILFLYGSAQSQTSFTVYQMNLQHGEGTDTSFNFQRQINAISDGDIIAVQERSTTENGWDTPLANAGFTQAVYRENSTLGDGNALWIKNTITVNSTNSIKLSNGFVGTGGVDVDKSAVSANVTINGKTFNVVSVHLCWSACSEQQRTDQANALLSWVNSTLGANTVIFGDMNFVPTSTQEALFATNYYDLWQFGIDNSIATANWGDRNSDGITDMPVDSNSITHDTRRIDRGYKNKSFSAIVLTSVSIPDTRATCPHALVNDGGLLPACTPEVQQLWDVTGDFGVKPTDHNITKFVFSTVTVKKCQFNTVPACQ